MAWAIGIVAVLFVVLLIRRDIKERADARGPADAASQQAAQTAFAKDFLKWGAGLVVVVGVVVAIIVGSGGEQSRKGGSSLAEVVCERSVRTQLKDPDSAKFEGVRSRSAGANKYEVTGTVRAQNSFGGTVVHTFTCTGDESSGTMRATSQVK